MSAKYRRMQGSCFVHHWCTKCPQHPYGLETVSKVRCATHTEGKQKARRGQQATKEEAVSSVCRCVCICVCVCKGRGGLKGTNSQWWSFPKLWVGASGAAGVVYDQRDVKAVHLQQVEQEGAIALRIQPHDPHMLSSEGGISAPGYLRKGLEDAVVQLHEEPGMGIKDSCVMLPSSASFYSHVTNITAP